MPNAEPTLAFLAARARLVAALSDPARWNQLPALMDALDRARRDAKDEPPAGPKRLLWIDRFSGALLDGRSSRERRDQVRRTAQHLWPWLGAHDPVAVARGRWDELPRSHA